MDTASPRYSYNLVLKRDIIRNLHRRVVPCTTRSPLPGETPGVGVNFISKETFLKMDKEGEFLNVWTDQGDFYGTPKPPANPEAPSGPSSRSGVASGYSRTPTVDSPYPSGFDSTSEEMPPPVASTTLSTPPSNSPSRKESLEVDQKDRKLYEESMTRGYVESALALLILVGVTGSGKSLFKRLVLGLSVPEFSPSTPLAESAVRSISICQVAVGGVKWVIVGLQEMMKMVAETIRGGVPLLASAWKDSSELAFTSTQPDSTDTTHSHSPQQTSRPELEKQEPIQRHVKTLLSCALMEIEIDLELMHQLTKSSAVQKLMDVDFIYLLDSGGQPPFREMLPHFVQQSSAIVLMQKLNERLDFRPTIKYREEGGRVDEGYTSQLTNEQILHQYVQAVQSQNSKVFVVGTHKDREGECECETREMKSKALLEAFRPVLPEQMELYEVGEPEQLLFPVDCTSRKPENEAVAEEFRKRVVQKCLGDKVKIPLPWFMLEQLLQLLATKMEVRVISIEECCEAAEKKLLMPPDVCKAAVRYLGKLNIIFYRPSILPGVVFANAQVILDKITELVHCNHAMKTNDRSVSDSIPSCMKSGEGLWFKDFGQVTSELLKKAFPAHYRDGLFSSADLLKLLEGLLIAGRLANGKYFIASLLPNLSVEKVVPYRVTSPEDPAPLVIYYPKKWVPVGVMPSLVVYLQNTCRWTPIESDAKPTCMYHNCIEFELPEEVPGSMVLIDSTKFLEIHVKPMLGMDRNVCTSIRDDVMTGLEEVHKSLHYDSAKAEVGFLCSGVCGNKDSVHVAKVVASKELWTCSKDKRRGGKLEERQKVWLDKGTSPRYSLSSSTSSGPFSPPLQSPQTLLTQSLATTRSLSSSSSLSDTATGAPKLDDVISRKSLAEIAKKITHWEPLGPYLDLTRQQEEEITHKHRDYGMQKRECLEVWKVMKGEGATYRALISAVEEAEDRQLADCVKSLLEK